MDINRLQTFLKVVQFGSFKQVAEVELLTQRAISKQITLLEDELNTKLFIRDANKITLTSQGQFFYSSAQDIVNNYHAALDELEQLNNSSTNILSVGYFSAFEKPLLQQALLKTAAVNPTNQLSIKQESNEHLYHGVSDGRLDLALSIDYGVSPISDNTKIVAKPIFSNQMIFGVSKLNPLSQKDALTEWDLEGQTILYYSPESSTFLLESFLASVPFLHDNEKIQRVSSIEQMNMLVALNQALAFYPGQLVENIPTEQNTGFLPLNSEQKQRYQIVALYNPNNQNPLLLELLKNF
ncbi:LysR family transcriptional regulator [Paucilactobacillus nenjiangensis]|uniref:LysR substrate-binding domain-containing protein n=1 Tax=Paucilactobacillus nenjiangensis TaxID=1296540 RepID=UPI0010F961B5|nr:LysR family transcriptional regulator [Paucilactobacillus nenjiangensis]